MNPHYSDCQKALSKLYEYLDDELEAIDREEIAAHLELCRPCLTEFEVERLFHEFVKREAPRPEARTEFKNRVLARLAEEARSLDGPSSAADEEPHGGIGGFIRFQRRFALAAVVVLAVGLGAGWIGRVWRPGKADWRILSGYHHASIAVEEIEIQTASFTEAKAFLANHLGSAMNGILPEQPPEGMVPLSSCVMPWHDTHLGHLTLRCAHGEELSVFLIPAQACPSGPGPAVQQGHHVYRAGILGCCRAVCWEEGDGYACALVADCEMPQLLTWAEAWHNLPHGSAAVSGFSHESLLSFDSALRGQTLTASR